MLNLLLAYFNLVSHCVRLCNSIRMVQIILNQFLFNSVEQILASKYKSLRT